MKPCTVWDLAFLENIWSYYSHMELDLRKLAICEMYRTEGHWFILTGVKYEICYLWRPSKGRDSLGDCGEMLPGREQIGAES